MHKTYYATLMYQLSWSLSRRKRTVVLLWLTEQASNTNQLGASGYRPVVQAMDELLGTGMEGRPGPGQWKTTLQHWNIGNMEAWSLLLGKWSIWTLITDSWPAFSSPENTVIKSPILIACPSVGGGVHQPPCDQGVAPPLPALPRLPSPHYWSRPPPHVQGEQGGPGQLPLEPLEEAPEKWTHVSQVIQPESRLCWRLRHGEIPLQPPRCPAQDGRWACEWCNDAMEDIDNFVETGMGWATKEDRKVHSKFPEIPGVIMR